MAFEMMVGLTVTNDDIYNDYRMAMRPLLERHGGGFRFDFKIAEVLKSEASHPINRVFAIYFENEEKMNLFFNHPEYKSIKVQYFQRSVSGTTIISQYNRT